MDIALSDYLMNTKHVIIFQEFTKAAPELLEIAKREAAWVTAGPHPDLPKGELTRAMEYLKQHWQRRYGLVEVG